MGSDRILRRRSTRSPDSPAPLGGEPMAESAPLLVGRADDPAEAAADRLADAALGRLAGLPALSAPNPGADLQRLPASAAPATIGAAGGQLDGDTSAMIDAHRGGGAPLPAPVRDRMESAFGTGIADVRVHDGASSAALSTSVSARAFTTGSDIFFGAGEYRPGTPDGDHVLAHEIAHTLQDSGGVRRKLGSKKKAAATPTATGTGGRTVPDVKGNEGLAPVTAEAFRVAGALNTDYNDVREDVSAWVTIPQQKQIADVAGITQQSKGDADKRKVKDLLRAFLMAEYTDIILEKIADPPQTTGGEPRALSPEEKKLMATRYFPRTLQNRDKWSGLVDKGPYAPETQSWLASEGFGAAIPRTPIEKAADGGGPRIDVRATFIGGAVLGAPRRMHLFILYTSSDGDQYYFRGGPDENDQYTEVDFGQYEPDTVDWDPSAPSTNVAKGEKAKQKFDLLVEGANQIDGLKVPYVGVKAGATAGGLGGLEAFVGGENCNSVAWTLLKRAGLPLKKPSGLHPGWGHYLGDFLKQGANALPPRESTVGVATQLAGAATAVVQVFSDRSGVEKAVTLPGGSNVELVLVQDGVAKIKFGPKGAIGWVQEAEVVKPRKPGRPFWVAGKGNAIIPIDGTSGFADPGKPIDVLDPSFVVGQTGSVDVRYDDPYGGTYEGKIEAKHITDVDPTTASASESESETSSESQSTGGTGGPKAVVMPVAQKPVIDQDSESSSEEEDEGKPPPVVATFESVGINGVPLYQRNGELHKYRGTNGKTTVGATGRWHDLVDGRRMVEFMIKTEAFWLDDRKWKQVFGADYPEK